MHRERSEWGIYSYVQGGPASLIGILGTEHSVEESSARTLERRTIAHLIRLAGQLRQELRMTRHASPTSPAPSTQTPSGRARERTADGRWVRFSASSSSVAGANFECSVCGVELVYESHKSIGIFHICVLSESADVEGHLCWWSCVDANRLGSTSQRARG